MMIFVNIAGLLLIGVIAWWFWLYKPSQTTRMGPGLVVRVENGTYQPNHLLLKADQENVIRFLRVDSSPCAETVVFPDLDLSENLPHNKEVSVTLPPLTAGKYVFHCQMQMIRGDIEIK